MRFPVVTASYATGGFLLRFVTHKSLRSEAKVATLCRPIVDRKSIDLLKVTVAAHKHGT